MSTSGQSIQRDEDAVRTLLAIKEFTRYLTNIEKDLSNMSKKWHNKEIAQGVGFVGTGIHEALQYLSIVRKVITKTQRILDKKAATANQAATEPAGQSRE